MASPVVQLQAQPAPKSDTVDASDIWIKVDETLEVPKGAKNPYDNLVVKRSGWKTIRIFVSSTFKDFHYEREVLVKEVREEIFKCIHEIAKFKGRIQVP